MQTLRTGCAARKVVPVNVKEAFRWDSGWVWTSIYS